MGIISRTGWPSQITCHLAWVNSKRHVTQNYTPLHIYKIWAIHNKIRIKKFYDLPILFQRFHFRQFIANHFLKASFIKIQRNILPNTRKNFLQIWIFICPYSFHDVSLKSKKEGRVDDDTPSHFHNIWLLISLISNIKWPFCAFIFWTYSCSHDEESKDNYNFGVHGIDIFTLAGFYGDAWMACFRLRRRTFCKFLIFIIVVNYTMSVLFSLLYTHAFLPMSKHTFFNLLYLFVSCLSHIL